MTNSTDSTIDMQRLVEVNKKEDIFPEYRDTPIGLLLEYHNLDRTLDQHDTPKLLIGMCMDSRKSVKKPLNFAFVLRTGGGNLRHSEFKISYAIAIGGIKHIALIAHNRCRMVGLHNRKEEFIDGLVEKAGWERSDAQEHFENASPMFEIGNEIDFVGSEAKRLRLKYPKIMVAPMLYNVDDNKIYQVIG